MLICYFFSIPHLVDNYVKNEDERGRKLMCERTLPSLLVFFLFERVLNCSKIFQSNFNLNEHFFINKRQGVKTAPQKDN